jgi:acyl carrier protein
MERTSSPATVEAVADVLRATLGLDGRPLERSTALFGSMPELDSMAVAEIVVALEERFGIGIDEDELTAEAFDTVGSLAALVDRGRG